MPSPNIIRKQMNTKNDMEKFFSNDVDIDKLHPEPINVELGNGKGICNITGTFSLFYNNKRNMRHFENTLVSIGSNIVRIDTGELMISGQKEDNIYSAEDVPIIALKLFNIINPVSIVASWKNTDVMSDFIPSYYLTPSPIGAGYRWWDIYDVYFYIPDSITSSEGSYSVKLLVKDIGRSSIINTLESSIDFSIKCSDNSKNNE